MILVMGSFIYSGGPSRHDAGRQGAPFRGEDVEWFGTRIGLTSSKETFTQRRLRLCRAKMGGVAGHQEECPCRAQQLSASIEQREQIPIQFPRFVLGTMSITGRIENDGIVVVLSANLTTDECGGVFHDPANGAVCQTG